MTTTRDVARLRAANRRVVEAARADLATAFARLPLGRPELARDALLEIVPSLTAKYGDVAATVAAEYFEEVRAREVGGQFTATLATNADEALVRDAVRREAGYLWSPDRAKTLVALAGSVQRFVLSPGRLTISENALRDPTGPGYARIPSGGKTCAFCYVMASRGFVYTSVEDAHGFHDNCRCIVTPTWRESRIKGYKPDEMYDKYLRARDESGSGDLKDILAQMRRMYPDNLRDAVVAL